LWYLLDWRYIYWFVLGLGFLLTGITGLPLGFSSLVLIIGVYILSSVKKLLGKDSWLEVLVVTGMAWIFSMAIGIQFSIIEGILVSLVMIFMKLRDSWGGDIRV